MAFLKLTVKLQEAFMKQPFIKSTKKYWQMLMLLSILMLFLVGCGNSGFKANIGLMNATDETYSLWIGDKKEPKNENKIEAAGLKFFATNVAAEKDEDNDTVHIKDRLQLNASKDGQLIAVQLIQVDQVFESNETFVIKWDGSSFTIQNK